MTTPQQKEQARMLYFQANLTQKQIAEYVGINERTLFDWMKQGDWKRARATAAAAPMLLADHYYNQLARINEFIDQREERPYATKEEIDIIRKLTMSVKQLKGTTTATVTETIQFCMLFSSFLQKRAPKIAPQVVDIMDEFVQNLRPEKQTFLKIAAEEKEIRNDYDEYLRDLQNAKPEESGSTSEPANNITGSDVEPGQQETGAKQTLPALNKVGAVAPQQPTIEKTSQKPEESGSSPDLQQTSGSNFHPQELGSEKQNKPAKTGSPSGLEPIIAGLRDNDAVTYLRLLEDKMNRYEANIELPSTATQNERAEQVARIFQPGVLLLKEVFHLSDDCLEMLITYLLGGGRIHRS